jgi:hypothetical protein
MKKGHGLGCESHGALLVVQVQICEGKWAEAAMPRECD